MKDESFFNRRLHADCVASPQSQVQRSSRYRLYFATGIVNSAPLAMLSGQRCMMLL